MQEESIRCHNTLLVNLDKPWFCNITKEINISIKITYIEKYYILYSWGVIEMIRIINLVLPWLLR